MTIKLSPAQKVKVLNARDIFLVMQQLLQRENKIDRNKEHFWLVCLANNNRVLMIELISLGSVNSTVVEPMDVFSFALQKRAVKLIMIHNHPSGEMRPSFADIDLTERMYAIGQFINMPVIDHLIISEKEFYSFKEAGLMTRIQKEKRYDLTFKEMDKLTAQLKKAEKDKEKAESDKVKVERRLIAAEKKIALAEKKRAIEIAQSLLEKGNYTVEEIATITQVPIMDIKKQKSKLTRRI